MNKGNVLVIGNSGVGKSTLVNAVLGEQVAKTGWGMEGTTSRLEIYENENVPFRIIDSVGFEPSYFKKKMAIHAVKQWSVNCAKKNNENGNINVIWFCVDGAARKLFQDSINSLSAATSIWKSVPIIVVITKSYSSPERNENIEMVYNAFAKQKRSRNLQKVIPVVASTFTIDESAYAAPYGITDLIDATNALMPEGLQAAKRDINAFKLKRKRALSYGAIGTATTAGVVIGATPVPIADALLLSPVELAEISALATIWGIKKDDKSKQFFDSIIQIGTVSAAAKAAISALKAIPGINIGASVLNAIIAGSFVFGIGEGTAYAFEQVYLGKKTLDDIDWVKKIMESKLSNEVLNQTQKVIEYIAKNNISDIKEITKILIEAFSKNKTKAS